MIEPIEIKSIELNTSWHDIANTCYGANAGQLAINEKKKTGKYWKLACHKFFD